MINLILIIVFAVLIAGGFISRFLRQRPKRKPPSHAVTVTVDDDHFTVDDSKTLASVRWADIIRVTMITTSHGPWFDNLFYHVVHAGGDITLPSEANGMFDFVEELEFLPGFDMEAYKHAVRSTRKDSFVVIVRNEESVA